MDPRLVKAQEDYRKALPYANAWVYDAIKHIPALIKRIIALERANQALTESISLDTLDPYDGKEEG